MNSFQPLLPRPGDTRGSLTQTRIVESVPSRRNISRACDACREKKMRCDGRKPACSSCVSLNKTCSRSNADGRSKERWKLKIQDLQQKNETLEDVLSSLQCNSFPEAVERLQELRSSNPQRSDDTGSHTLDWSESSNSRSDPSESSANVRYDDLPPQLITRRSLSAYFSCGSTLFYTMPRETCEDLMSSLYEQPADINKSDICAVCAITAMGSQYSAEEIPEVAKDTYFRYASSLLSDAAEQDPLMGMRASAALAVYLILLKSSSARTMTATGLNISRWNMRRQIRNATREGRLEWARVLRTLAFIECWLSFTLGYPFDLGQEDKSLLDELAFSELSANPFGVACHNLIQSHIYKITLMSADVHSELQLTSSLSTLELDQLPLKLDTWHDELPESLRLSALTTENNAAAVSVKRPLLFMHMVHIGSRIVLYERVILVALNSGLDDSDQPIVHRVFGLAEEVHHVYASFAQQLARIIRLLYKDQSILSRCWLTIYSCFHASVTLLLRTAQNLVRGDCRSLVSTNLSHVRDCLKALDCCNEQDIVAMKFTSEIAPLYEDLRQIADDSEMRVSDGAAMPVQLDRIIRQLVSAMGMPFQELWI